jgi:NAD(P)-dependent dehydrogenase (short-subunit alcohol dehydrogenase family)
MPTALVTGASTGIGRATALRLARAGWTVLAGVRDDAAAELLTGAADGRGRVEPIRLDVTDAEQIARAAARVAALDGSGPGRLDALVNNAGIGVGGPLELIDVEDLRRQLDVNVVGQIAVTQALLPALRAAHTPRATLVGGRHAGGRIVFLSSVGGRVAMAFTAPYAASKHAIEAIGDALRVELRTSHVQVALIEPGSVATPIWDKSRAAADRVYVPESLRAEYGHVPAAIDKTLRSTAERGVPPERVAETIERALTASRMRSRYVVGRDARAMITLSRLLPDHVFDRIARRALGV